MQLLGYDLWNATYWMDVRKVENRSRSFGSVPTAIWTAFRKVQPWQQDPRLRPQIPYGIVAYNFLKSTPATTFYPSGPVMPGTDANPIQARSEEKQ
jgi:histidine ammonia-lyase